MYRDATPEIHLFGSPLRTRRRLRVRPEPGPHAQPPAPAPRQNDAHTHCIKLRLLREVLHYAPHGSSRYYIKTLDQMAALTRQWGTPVHKSTISRWRSQWEQECLVSIAKIGRRKGMRATAMLEDWLQ